MSFHSSCAMDAERLGSMSGWCWESVPGEVPKALSMSFSAEGMREGKGERERERERGREREGDIHNLLAVLQKRWTIASSALILQCTNNQSSSMCSSHVKLGSLSFNSTTLYELLQGKQTDTHQS